MIEIRCKRISAGDRPFVVLAIEGVGLRTLCAGDTLLIDSAPRLESSLSPESRACVDCRHSRRINDRLCCGHPALVRRDPVTGERWFCLCSGQREWDSDQLRRSGWDVGRCGWEGRRFEARSPAPGWWRRLLWRLTCGT
jgi:hypothetical protein